jgi:Flp pilus assembly protein TadD
MYYEMARLTWALGNGVEAVLYLTKTVQVDPNNSEAFFLLAKIMHSLQRFEDRDVFIQKAQVLDPESLDIRLWQQSIEN